MGIQTKHHLSIETPLGEDVLLVRRFSLKEELGKPFEVRAELLSEQRDIRFEDILGGQVTISIQSQHGTARSINGYVREFEQIGDVLVANAQSDGEVVLTHYQAVIVPWVWLLSQSTDCKIFQEMSVPEIIEETFSNFGFTDFKKSLHGDYGKRDFCVQYRETALAFVTRLMEQEGIYYHFEHSDRKHTLVLTDDPASHEPLPDAETIPYFPEVLQTREVESIHTWHVRKQVRTSKVTLRDFNFKSPSTIQEKDKELDPGHSAGGYEAYDYEGSYVLGKPTDDGGHGDEVKRYAGLRLEETHATYELITGTCDVTGMFAGGTFELRDDNHDLRRDQEREYLVVSTLVEAAQSTFRSFFLPLEGETYSCRFSVIPSKTTYRLDRVTPRPIVEGPQTAIVVGPSGEDIWVDEHGRVKVQFHWDRLGSSDETSSCWVRVSQNWAGKNWGGMFIPHIGHEVIVEFLEGDPDRPIITGRVYNGDNPTPEPLPEHKHRSIIEDDFGNKIVFDATPGKEHLYLHSPSHSSHLILGRSTEQYTASNGRKWTIGNETKGTLGDSNSHSVGNSTSLTLGNKFAGTLGTEVTGTVGSQASCYVGQKISTSLGTELSLAAGVKLSAAWTKEFTVNKAKYARKSDSSITHDAKEEITITAGGSHESFQEMNDKKLELSFGKGQRKSPVSPAPFLAVINQVAGWAGTLTAAQGAKGQMLASIQSDMESQNRKTNANDQKAYDKSKELEKEWGNNAVAYFNYGTSVLTHAVATMAQMMGLANETFDPPSPGTKHARILLDKKGVLIEAGKTKIIVHEDSSVTIDSPKKINIIAKNAVKIDSKGPINMKSSQKIQARFGSMADFKNLKVMS